MKARIGKAVVLVGFAAMSLHCGGDGAGYFIGGTFGVRYTDPSTGQPVNPVFQFPARTRVEGALPSGRTAGLVGSCTLQSGRYLQFQRVGAAPTEVQSVEISVLPPAQDTCTNCTYGRLTVNLGNTSFQGSEVRGGTSTCTFHVTPTAPNSYTMSVDCPALTAAGDPRTIAVNAQLDASDCDVLAR